MTYLNTDHIEFTVNAVPKNSYFGIAFDTDLINTDMVTFHGDGKVRDLWSNRLARPFDDKIYNIKLNNGITNLGDTVNFKVQRERSTGDLKDFTLECGTKYKLAWVAQSASNDLNRRPDKRGTFTFQMPTAAQGCRRNQVLEISKAKEQAVSMYDRYHQYAFVGKSKTSLGRSKATDTMNQC